MPPERPIKKPVNIMTRVDVEPTAPKEIGPEKRPMTARSAILKSTCNKLDKIRGMLKMSIL